MPHTLAPGDRAGTDIEVISRAILRNSGNILEALKTGDKDRLAALDREHEALQAALRQTERGPATFDEQVEHVLSTYQFERYEFGTLYQGGRCVQLGLTITSPSSPKARAERFLVICNIESGTPQWSCYGPPFRKDVHTARVMIAAAKARIRANREARRRRESAAA